MLYLSINSTNNFSPDELELLHQNLSEIQSEVKLNREKSSVQKSAENMEYLMSAEEEELLFQKMVLGSST